VVRSGDRVGLSQRPDTTNPSGVIEQGEGAWGLLRNVGDPAACSANSRVDYRVNEVQACRHAFHVRRERTKRAQAELPPSEGNEARRDERREVIAPS
jgi:hypothetical protein